MSGTFLYGVCSFFQVLHICCQRSIPYSALFAFLPEFLNFSDCFTVFTNTTITQPQPVLETGNEDQQEDDQLVQGTTAGVCSGSKRALECAFACIGSLVAQLCLDLQQTVVLGNAVRPAQGACFNLTGTGGDGQIRNG